MMLRSSASWKKSASQKRSCLRFCKEKSSVSRYAKMDSAISKANASPAASRRSSPSLNTSWVIFTQFSKAPSWIYLMVEGTTSFLSSVQERKAESCMISQKVSRRDAIFLFFLAYSEFFV